MPARVIASTRGRGSKPAILILGGCGNKRCHPGTIARVNEGKRQYCQKCRSSLKKILTLNTVGNERITAVINPVDEVIVLKIIRTDLSTSKKRIKTYLFHKGELVEMRI
ncbi:MAG: hypothetical protein UT31_C0038G0007 [Parcubacteria group bacterium GW2011_GWF2_39_13b]|nr:MAG: hypothetical protein UT31_C0038G0007 [Parcubacteria group bacterium GW2011_GWF2_39_13b]